MRVLLVVAICLALVAALEASERWGGSSTENYVPVVLWHGKETNSSFLHHI